MATVFKVELVSTYVSDAPYMDGRKGFDWSRAGGFKVSGPAEQFVKFVIDACPNENGKIECVIS